MEKFTTNPILTYQEMYTCTTLDQYFLKYNEKGLRIQTENALLLQIASDWTHAKTEYTQTSYKIKSQKQIIPHEQVELLCSGSTKKANLYGIYHTFRAGEKYNHVIKKTVTSKKNWLCEQNLSIFQGNRNKEMLDHAVLSQDDLYALFTINCVVNTLEELNITIPEVKNHVITRAFVPAHLVWVSHENLPPFLCLHNNYDEQQGVIKYTRSKLRSLYMAEFIREFLSQSDETSVEVLSGMNHVPEIHYYLLHPNTQEKKVIKNAREHAQLLVYSPKEYNKLQGQFKKEEPYNQLLKILTNALITNLPPEKQTFKYITEQVPEILHDVFSRMKKSRDQQK